MRTFRIVAFWAILAALIGSLIIYGKCMAHPAYDEQGNIVGETLDPYSVYEAQGERTTLDLRFKEAPAGKEEKPSLQGVVIGGHLEYPSECGEYPGILDLLRECLKYIEDGSIDQGRNLSLGVYHPITRDGVAQDEADRAAYEAERYRRETELNKKIKAMIKKLEGENK